MWVISKLLFSSLLIFALNTRSFAQTSYRLSKDVKPVLYDIAIKPYLQSTDGTKQFTFDGEVNITLHAEVTNVTTITLHKDYIDIVEGILFDSNGNVLQNISTNDMTYESAFDKLSIRLLSPLVVDANYKLYFKYVGQIRNGLAGVFRATYDDINWYGITQLQRIDARTAFPCFDEPEFKAKFRMRISRPKEYSSFFNTRLLSTTNDGTGRYLDQFEVTPPMSTYLVAFLISDFESHGEMDFKMIMHSKFNNKTGFSYEVGLKTLAAYDKYTQLPYKSLGNPIMQKAGSTKFPHNGMENWGLVIYHDSVLAHEPDYTDGWSDKEYTITILVHETAHMWFGNSVTFKWWSYFWLNEAFARYYQYFLAHEIYPEYELDKQFVVNQVHLIFGTDATNSSQPMTSSEESINTPSEIGYKFSSIAYAKGATIIRMIRNLMGKENFDSAIRVYLKENHLKNTIPEDLFKHLRIHWPTEQHLDINQFLSDWTEQVGYPMLTVSTTSKGEYSLKQQRFLLDTSDGSDASLTYTIPITYTTAREQNFEDLTPKFYFNKTHNEFTFGNSNADKWIIFNIQQSIYYRIFYDGPLLEKLQRAFMADNHSGIHVINRAYLVDDLFTYGRIGLMGYDEVFQFMEYLAYELEYLPWYSALKGINIVHQRLTLEQHQQFGSLLFELLDQVYRKLGFEKSNDSVLDVYNRNKIINWLCKYHHSDCNNEAQHIFHLHYEIKTKPKPDFRETLYCAACRNDQSSIYNNLKQMFYNESLIVEQERILRAMGCTRYYIDRQYEFILSNDVPQALKTIGISGMYTQTIENVTPVFRLVTENVEHLAEVLESWSSTASVISGICNYFTTQEQLKMLKEFIAEKGSLFGTSVTTLENSVKTVESNLMWAETHLGKLFNYLDQRNGAVAVKAFISLVLLLATLLLQLFLK